MNELSYSDVTDELSANFMAYAAAVNTDRAIPDVKSGLKPVARRILFDMHELGIASSKPHKKCALIVGDTMGKYHPHGDSSIYQALVRLSQPWSMRYPLIDFHGNKGSIGGDPAASMRYTEAKLFKLTEIGMLEGLKKKVVPFQDNYSEDETEPVTLPSLFPNILCNPNTGIGVAIACNWLPHNLGEVIDAIVAYVDNNDISIKDIVENYLPGPDFPLGGKIINKNNMLSCYQTGKGRVIVQARYEVEKRGTKEMIVFKELPYGVNSETLLEEIDKLYVADKITGIAAVRDETNKNGLRIVVELAKGGNVASIVSKLYNETNLQKNSNFNQVALVDKVPTLLNLKQVIMLYVEHQIDIIKKETQFDLNKAQDRLKIVEGLLIALEDIDNVIKLIKESPSSAEAVVNLCKKYDLFERQAKAIVEMKLGRLAGLEKIELQNEQKELIEKIKNASEILSSSNKQNEILKTKLIAFKKKFNDPRRTELAQIEITKEAKLKEAIEPEDVVVAITKGGHIKRIPVKSFRIQKRKGKGVKNKDDSVLDIIKTNTVDTLILFSTLGKMYRIVVDDVPDCLNSDVGTAVHSLVKLAPGEEIVAITSLYNKSTATSVVFITANGMIKKSDIKEYLKSGRSAAGVLALKLKEGDSIVDITFLKDQDLILLSKNGMSIRVQTSDIANVGRIAMGVKGMRLGHEDHVVAGVPVHKETDDLAIFTASGYGKRVPVSEFTSQGRNGKGITTYKGQTVVGGAMVEDNDNILIIGRTSNLGISAKDIPITSRTASGNVMINGGGIASIVKI